MPCVSSANSPEVTLRTHTTFVSNVLKEVGGGPHSHLFEDVQTADKLALDDQLRKRRPLVHLLQICSPPADPTLYKLSFPPTKNWNRKANARCRTASSWRMSKLLNGTAASRRILVVVLLNPHRGVLGLPFMNSTTSACTHPQLCFAMSF